MGIFLSSTWNQYFTITKLHWLIHKINLFCKEHILHAENIKQTNHLPRHVQSVLEWRLKELSVIS